MTAPSFILLLERHGGILGVPMRAELNSADLAADESIHLWSLVEKALQSPPSSTQPDQRRRQPDSFTYRLTVVAPDHSDEYAFDESAVGPELRPLVHRLEQHLTL
jgi:hypothetical protein